MTETKVKKATTVNLTIVSMGGKSASGGVFVASGKAGKLRPNQVCSVPADVAEALEGCEALKVTKDKATHELVGGEVVPVSA